MFLGFKEAKRRWVALGGRGGETIGGDIESFLEIEGKVIWKPDVMVGYSF